MANIVHKEYAFGDTGFHHLIFKNVSENEIQDLYNEIAGILFELKATLLHQFFIGCTHLEKQIKKTEKQIFDERDWPLTWLNQSDSKTISGHFTAISGVTVKGITASGFTSKTIDTPDFRYGFIGDIYINDINSAESIIEPLNMALAFTGGELSNSIQTNIYSGNTIDFKLDAKEQSFILNNHKKANALINSQVLMPKNNTLSFSSFNEGYLVKSQNNTLLKINIADKAGDSENEIIAILTKTSELITKHNLSWKNLQLAYVFANNSKQIKLLKAICKEMKIPLSALLFIIEESDHNRLCISAEFGV